MFINLRWRLLAFTRKIWFRATLYSLSGVAAAAMSAVLGRFFPEAIAKSLGADAVGSILQVIAASMLSVTIFALSTLVVALANATNASPRAARLVCEDPTAQGILASFLGMFIFSLVGIIALSSGVYGAGERFVLFLFTLVLIVITVVSLIRWIQHITQLGRIDDNLERLERASIEAFGKHRRAPQLGGTSWDPDAHPPTADAVPLFAKRSGYVRHFDIDALANHLNRGQRAWILARPGAFVGPNRPLALIARDESDEPVSAADLVALRKAWLVSKTRNFDQDPRFGLCVLAEVASKSLSAAVNDVGTAIGVLGRLARVLAALEHDDGGVAETCSRHDNILVQPITALDLLQDAFRPIARDGATTVELGVRLQATLAHVARLAPASGSVAGDMGAAAAATANDALLRARLALQYPPDVAEIEAVASHLLRQHGIHA